MKHAQFCDLYSQWPAFCIFLSFITSSRIEPRIFSAIAWMSDATNLAAGLLRRFLLYLFMSILKDYFNNTKRDFTFIRVDSFHAGTILQEK